MQNIVTDTEEDAKKLVNHLRKFNLGRASFLPISSVKGKKLDKIKTEKGVIGIASDLVKFDKKYEQIILSLLGRTLIVDNMDNAIAIARKNSYGFRIVTLEGDVLNPSGAISGGSVSTKTVNILGRSREIEDLKKYIAKLQEKIANLKKEKEDYESSIEDLLEEVTALDNELKDIEIVYATEKQKVISIEEAVSKVEKRLEKLREEDKSIDKQLNINKETQKDLNDKIAELDEENNSLNKEIEEDRLAHGKKPLKKKDDNQPPASGGTGNDKDSISEELPEDVKTQKCSISDPESGWFRKGEHKHVFAYAVETACDKHGWILGYTVHPGNEHDSRTFKALYDKISKLNPQMVVADAGYKTPAIAHRLLEDGIQPLFPYTRPKTKEGFFGKHDFAYDEYYNCYICPGAHILTYSTTNRSGYKEYKSCGEHCAECQYLSKCTESKDHIKLITRHVWEEYLEKSDEIRYRIGSKEIYEERKETIERNFGTAKEHHGMRYTQQIGREKMAMKVGLTFACLNMKKLARILCKAGPDDPKRSAILTILKGKIEKKKNRQRQPRTIAQFVRGLSTV